MCRHERKMNYGKRVVLDAIEYTVRITECVLCKQILKIETRNLKRKCQHKARLLINESNDTWTFIIFKCIDCGKTLSIHVNKPKYRHTLESLKLDGP